MRRGLAFDQPNGQRGRGMLAASADLERDDLAAALCLKDQFHLFRGKLLRLSEFVRVISQSR